MKIPVIILNYNSSDDCRKCIGYLKRQEGVETEIVVVDNCSPRDGEQEAVSRLCAEHGCTFIQAKENRGYNAGNNIGLRYAASCGYGYALIANPDMEFPETDYLAKMAQTMEEHPEVAVCGSNIIGCTGKRESPWHFSPAWKEFVFVYLLDKVLENEVEPMAPHSGYCDLVQGCCLMVRMVDIIRIGYFDENLFLFCEESTLGRQVQKIDKKIYYLNEAMAVHLHIESQKGNFKNRYKIHAKSKKYYLMNHSGYNKIVIWLICLFQFVYDIVYINFKIKRMS